MIAYQFLTRNLVVKLCFFIVGCQGLLSAGSLENYEGDPQGDLATGVEVGHGLWIEGGMGEFDYDHYFITDITAECQERKG